MSRPAHKTVSFGFCLLSFLFCLFALFWFCLLHLHGRNSNNKLPCSFAYLGTFNIAPAYLHAPVLLGLSGSYPDAQVIRTGTPFRNLA